MSRVGNKPINIPGGVKITVQENLVAVEGPKGKLSKQISPLIKIKLENEQVLVARTSEAKQDRSLHGLSRTLIANMVEGTTVGYQKTLELHGVGYRAEVQGKKIIFQIGLSHPVDFALTEGIEAETVREKQVTKITVRGIDKELVGRTAAQIRALYPSEPYKGKGIKYTGEVIRRKSGKAAAATA